LLDYITNNYEYIDYYNFNYRIARKILAEIFNVKLSKFKKDLIKKYKFFGNSMFGHKKQLNGIIYSSVGEYYIAVELIKLNIKFLYNKKYPVINYQYRYDFYLIQYDIYIEYAGMLINNIKNKYTDSYKKSINNKIRICDENNFNLIISSDYLEIINEIKLLYNDKKEKY